VTLALLLGLLFWHLYVTAWVGQADAPTLMRFGARKVLHGFPQPPWRLMASTFLHAGWIHLLGNLLVLAAWGACLERLLGRLELLGLFLLSGLWGSLLSDMYGPNILAMGASGAAFAMVTSVLALAVTSPERPEWDGDAVRWRNVSLAALALNLVTAAGFSSFVQGARLDHWAHAGGAICGLLLGALSGLAAPRARRAAFWCATLALAAGAAAVIAARGASPFG
jgi:rhomboid protease GluP